MKKYLSALVIAVLLTTTLYGSQIREKIEVVKNSISIMVSGEKVESDNFIYNGTTYVPLREISELLDKEVDWDGKNKTVNIGNVGEVRQEKVLTLMTMENGDQVKIELYPEVAPITVENFVNLVEEGFYEGLIFHRVIPGFMIQGGDPDGDGTGGSGKTIKGEFLDNGIKNNLSHTKGVLSMARSYEYDSASSQFFIVAEYAPYLDGEYAAFGKVVEGLDIIDKIVNVETDLNDKPLKDQAIKSFEIIK